MNNNEKIKELTNILKGNSPILFTGAGFSYGATKKIGSNIEEVPKNLTEIIMNKFLGVKKEDEYYDEISKYNLREICNLAIDTKTSKELNEFLIEQYSGLKPAQCHHNIIKYSWRKIYTTNIDDVVEKIYRNANKTISVQNSKKELSFDPENDVTYYYKLHGCIKNVKEGFTFADKEYYNKMSTLDHRLMSLCTDMQKENIIFLGTNFDEPDIEYYLDIYRKAGYESRRGRLIFINPKPSYRLTRLIKDVEGLLIEWTTKEFMEYLEQLKYNPNEIEKIEKKMNYEGFYKLKDTKELYQNDNDYTCTLYEGNATTWQDIFYQWDFLHPIYKDVIEDIKNKTDLLPDSNVHCLSLVSNSYTGKTTILKRIAVELLNIGYEVIEFKGEEFNIRLLKEYMNLSHNEKFILIFDNASPNYPIIEKLLLDKAIKNQLFIIAASRLYYHNKKKYYLIGENKSFKEYKIGLKVKSEYAINIVKKLEEKGFLGYLKAQNDDNDKARLIIKENDLMTFMIKLNSGVNFTNNIIKDVEKIVSTAGNGNSVIIILAIFDILDIAYLPKELIPIMFNKNIHSLLLESDCMYNMIKTTEQGIQIRNNYYSTNIINKTDIDSLVDCIYNVLINIAAKVSEKKWNYYRIIFEQLTKEDRLRNELKIPNDKIRLLYYKIKDWYENVSYYWLQLGLVEQADTEFEKALNHLEQAASISADKYQIQHALGRNYLRHANSLDDLSIAMPIFEVGEERLIKLIREQETNQPSAYSINCYINEKIKFINKFNLNISRSQYKEMFEYIKIMITKRIEGDNQRDIHILIKFIKLLKENHIHGILVFNEQNHIDIIIKNLVIQNKINII